MAPTANQDDSDPVRCKNCELNLTLYGSETAEDEGVCGLCRKAAIRQRKAERRTADRGRTENEPTETGVFCDFHEGGR